MRSRVVLAVLLAALVVPILPAGASTTRTVQVVERFDYDSCCSAEFSPVNVGADPGDTIEIAASEKSHRYVAFAGANFDSGETTGPFSFTYGGGEVKYRCTLHSSLVEPSGNCSGMCGAINDFTPPPAPSFDSPPAGSVLGNGYMLHFRGTVPGARKARVYDNGILVHDEHINIDSYDPEYHGGPLRRSEPFFEVWISLGNGAHDIEVVGIDYAGNSSPASSLQITVSDATPPPTPTPFSPGPHWMNPWNAPIAIFGEAPESARVTLERGGLIDEHLQGSVHDVLPESLGDWKLDVPALDEGRHLLEVRSYDPAGNVSAPATVEVIADYTSPTAIWTSPSNGETKLAVDGRVSITGTATDDWAIGSIRWRAQRVITHPQYDVLLREYRGFAGCPGCGSARTSTWSANPALPLGTYRMFIEASDMAGNWVSLSRRTVTVVSPGVT